MNKPLTSWHCDVCREKIENAKDGYVVWQSECQDFKYFLHSFRIIHQHKCDRDKSYSSSSKLVDFLGHDGLTKILAMLSNGLLILSPTGNSCSIKSGYMDEFVDFVRRVQTPHYEEARLLFSDRDVIDSFDGSNEIQPYLEDVLKRVIKEYQVAD